MIVVAALCVSASAVRAQDAPTSKAPAHILVISHADGTPVGGKWAIDFPADHRPFTIELAAAADKLTGAVKIGVATVDVTDGHVKGNTISFVVKSPHGNRTITFNGTAKGDEMAFTRDVKAAPDSPAGGPGIFGTDSPHTFTAKRMK